DARQGPDMASLDRAVADSLMVEHRSEAGFSGGAHAQVVLQHPPQQLAATAVELTFQLSMVESIGVGPGQPTEHVLETLPRRSEGAVGALRPLHRRPPLPAWATRRARKAAMPACAAASSSALAA